MLAAAVAYSAARIVKISKGQKDFLGQENIHKRQTRRKEKKEREREREEIRDLHPSQTPRHISFQRPLTGILA